MSIRSDRTNGCARKKRGSKIDSSIAALSCSSASILHQSNEIDRVDELLPKAGIVAGIKDSLQPINHEYVSFGLLEIGVVHHEDVQAVLDAHINWNDLRAEIQRIVGQHPDAGAKLNCI